MNIIDISTTPTTIETSHGETIYELIGRTVGEKAKSHSVAHVVIAPGRSSLRHFHPEADESYYIMAGHAKIEIRSETAVLLPGQSVFIPSGQPHKIHNLGEIDLALLVVCVPAWEPSNTVWLETH